MPRNYQQLAPSAQFENQLASSLYSVGFILPGSRSTVAFITRDFHALISRQHSQTNRRGLYTLFLTSKSPCMQKISSVDALLSTQNVLSRSGRFGGGHTGWSQLQLASSVSPLCLCQSPKCAFPVESGQHVLDGLACTEFAYTCFGALDVKPMIDWSRRIPSSLVSWI